MEQIAGLLRDIAARAGVERVRQVALRPGVKAVYRVTIQYDRMRAADTVATLISRNTGEALLEVVYLGHFGNRPITRQLSARQVEDFAVTLSALAFDKLPDQPNIPFYGVDVWLVERGAGGFVKSVLVAPAVAKDAHAGLVECVRAALPEAVREIVA
jgi:hypothetical protein